MSEAYEMAKKVKGDAQPDVAAYVEGIAERKIDSMKVEEVADLSNTTWAKVCFYGNRPPSGGFSMLVMKGDA